MSISTDDLKMIYEKAREFAIVYKHSEPDVVELNPDGTISVVKRSYYGECYEDDTLELSADDLTKDLSEVIKTRQEIAERAKIERKRQYEELLKEPKETI